MIGRVSKTTEGGRSMRKSGGEGNSFSYIGGGKVVMSYTLGTV